MKKIRESYENDVAAMHVSVLVMKQILFWGSTAFLDTEKYLNCSFEWRNDPGSNVMMKNKF